MTKGRIERTAICYFDKEDDCFVIKSPLAFICATGENAEQARAHFSKELEACGVSPDAEQRIAEVVLSSADDQIHPLAATYLNKLARELGCTRGQAIEYLVLFHQVAELPENK